MLVLIVACVEQFFSTIVIVVKGFEDQLASCATMGVSLIQLFQIFTIGRK
jgi:ABC-type lipoprotein release transport system permease subunit